MIPYLQAMHNNRPDPALLARIKELGFGGVRCDMQQADQETVNAAVKGVDEAGLQGLFVVRFEQMHWFPVGTQVELRNEPDIEGPTASAYASEMRTAHKIANGQGLRLWVGVVSNPHARGRAYLDAIKPTLDMLPVSVGLSWHRYPNGGVNERFDLPHAGFASRDAEVAYIQSIAGAGRPWGISEFGYHTAARSGGWWLFRRTRRWSDQQVADLTAREWDFWARHGAAFAVQYQITDGPSDVRLNRYGIMRVDGTFKPVALVVPR